MSDLLTRLVEAHPVVVLTGARQVGKSTLLRRAQPVSDWPYRTFDDPSTRAKAEQDPDALWRGESRIVLDEVQRVPEFLLSVKRAVDEDRSRRFVLSGSANLLLLQRVSESLAGRAVYFVLSPMTVGEWEGRPRPEILDALLSGEMPPEGKWEGRAPLPVIVRGLMPSCLSFGRSEDVIHWWEGYVTSYLERDLRQMSRIDALTEFRGLMEALALRTGQILNLAGTARDAAIPPVTARRYVSWLEASHLAYTLPGFARNRTKRLIKAPKLHWVDPGLAACLSGLHDAGTLESSREAGSLFENLVVHHVRVLSEFLTPRARLLHWRTAAGQEVDLVVEHGRRLVAMEVKLSERPDWSEADGLRAFLAEYPEAACGVLVHGGSEIRWLDPKIVAVPWTWLAGVGRV